jgi:hypothetical protein
MLARRLTTILPAMTLAEAIETTRIPSVVGRTGDRTAVVNACHLRSRGDARGRSLLPWLGCSAQPLRVVRGRVKAIAGFEAFIMPCGGCRGGAGQE